MTDESHGYGGVGFRIRLALQMLARKEPFVNVVPEACEKRRRKQTRSNTMNRTLFGK
jgi:hypothetical protein